MRVEFGSSSNVGRVREHNEDAYEYLHYSGGDALIVCDGMGGHAAGDVASSVARSAIAAALVTDHYQDPRELLYRALESAHQQVLAMAGASGARSGMGTTAVVALIRGASLFVGHVGDSRAYLVRDGLTSQLTRDQTRVQAMVDSGLLTEAAAKSHPDAGVLSQAIGQPRGLLPFVTPDREGIPLRPGDLLVLCTDGVYDALEHQEFTTLTASRTAQGAADTLVNVAVDRDGQDNATAVVGVLCADEAQRPELPTVEDLGPPPARRTLTLPLRPGPGLVYWALGAVLLLFGLMAAFLAGRISKAGAGSIKPAGSAAPGPSSTMRPP